METEQRGREQKDILPQCSHRDVDGFPRPAGRGAPAAPLVAASCTEPKREPGASFRAECKGGKHAWSRYGITRKQAADRLQSFIGASEYHSDRSDLPGS